VTALKDTLDQLYARVPLGRRFGLERLRSACAALGNPERSFEAIHVGGTNGKGSVCAFTSSMLRHAKHGPVGLYTSPHLNRFAERIQIDGTPISDEQLVEFVGQALSVAGDMTSEAGLTFFEVATLAAFLAFRANNVRIAVLEVGLGGLLDATNVIPPPRVVALTRVAYDHMDVLGDSIREIAIQKAAIIKAGSKVITGKLHPHAVEVVTERAREVGAEIIPLGSAEPYPGAQLAYPRMAMFGTNLAVASTIARTLGASPDEIARGIEDAVWPGRNELLHRNGQELTLLDCCHNPDGAVLLSHIIDATSSETAGGRRNVVLVFGTVEGKNWKAMLARLEHSAAHRVYVAPEVKRSAHLEAMTARYPGELAPSISDALQRARAKVGPRGLVVVAGSIFVVGPARAALLGLPTDPPIDL
jgi:dihydrofolate synthase / folylpolyglutamate synthase